MLWNGGEISRNLGGNEENGEFHIFPTLGKWTGISHTDKKDEKTWGKKGEFGFAMYCMPMATKHVRVRALRVNLYNTHTFCDAGVIPTCIKSILTPVISSDVSSWACCFLLSCTDVLFPHETGVILILFQSTLVSSSILICGLSNCVWSVRGAHGLKFVRAVLECHVGWRGTRVYAFWLVAVPRSAWALVWHGCSVKKWLCWSKYELFIAKTEVEIFIWYSSFEFQRNRYFLIVSIIVIIVSLSIRMYEIQHCENT